MDSRCSTRICKVQVTSTLSSRGSELDAAIASYYPCQLVVIFSLPHHIVRYTQCHITWSPYQQTKSVGLETGLFRPQLMSGCPGHHIHRCIGCLFTSQTSLTYWGPTVSIASLTSRSMSSFRASTFIPNSSIRHSNSSSCCSASFLDCGAVVCGSSASYTQGPL